METKRVKNADVCHPSCTVVMYRRKSAPPVHNVLIIGQPDHMLRDLRNSKGSTELSANSMWILASGDTQYVSNLVFSLCMLESLVKVQDTAMSLLHAPTANTSC